MSEANEGEHFPFLNRQVDRHLEGEHYLRRLFRDLAPTMEQLDEWTGFCTQIDNYIAGLRDALRAEHENTVATSPSTHRQIGDTPGCDICAMLEPRP